jgi:hypothetical protein
MGKNGWKMEVVMKGSVYKVVFIAMALLVVSGCGDVCDDKHKPNLMDFIDGSWLEEDSGEDIFCELEDVLDFIEYFDGGENEGPEPTYYYNFDVEISITDDFGEFIVDIEPSYDLLLNTENCGSFIYTGTPSDFRTGYYTPNYPIQFEFDDFLPASCGDSAEVTLTIIVDHPGYAPVSSAYDFTLHYWKPGQVVNLINSRTDSEKNIYLQLVAEQKITIQGIDSLFLSDGGLRAAFSMPHPHVKRNNNPPVEGYPPI